MLASKNEIMHFFEEDGFLQTLWLGWEGDENEYWNVLEKIIQEVWNKFGEKQGYISYDDIEEIREFMIQRLQQENEKSHVQKISTKAIGNFDFSLNEATNLSKRDIENIVRDEVKKHLEKEKYLTKTDVKDYLDKDEVKAIIRKAIVDQYKVLWMKSSFYINQI